ncbi:extracellular solute-binding protein [Cohnella thailandensis]|uniref:Extracellular solute-binding protein n=1 Tax=Cohnella thailandensis TaxID=557557 RepID=A0A841T057_9BACL|nr:extracellular solute-binding protein [Cohnella thailandensis]MBB6635905.1 extracellular solute-binding protein [Cohnella thailandensis]MBP1976283.1 multiple sugar transport system substrate-binding protein [Cohnella thailandensis]
MRKKASLKTAAVMMMSAAMLLSACSNNSGSNNTAGESPSATSGASPSGSAAATESSKPQELVTLRVLVMEPGTKWNKYPDSKVAQDIAEKVGVKIEYVEADENKFNVLLASGDLPDIVRTDVNKYQKQLIEGNLIVPMDDMLADRGKDITANIATVVDYSKKNWSNGTGSLYFLPPQVQPKPGTAVKPITIGPTIRWDWYKEIGAPELNTMDDLLNAVEQIVEKHPTTDDGKKVYGVSMWQDWGLWPYLIPPLTFTGLTGATSDLTASQIGGAEFISTLTDENSNFWTAMDFYNKAQRRGLLDPDSLTMKNNDYMAKATAGQIVVGPATWAMGDFNAQHTNDGKGFLVVPAGKVAWTGGVNPLGWQDKAYAISKSSKNPEKAMEFLNYIFSYDGARTMYNGVEGKDWTLVDGKPTLTEETLALKATGGVPLESSGLGLDLNIIGLGGDLINPEDGQPVNLFNTEEALAKAATPLEKDFAEHYGATYSGQVFEKLIDEGKLITFTTWMDGMSDDEILKRNTVPGVTLNDDWKKKEAALKELATRQAAKIVLSKDDAAFAKNKQEALDAFKKAGAEEFTKYYNDEVTRLRTEHGL